MEKIAWDGPEWGREGLLPANPDLVDILGDTDFDFENVHISGFFWFPDFQLSRPDLGLGWARLGPGLGWTRPGWIWLGLSWTGLGLGRACVFLMY